MQARRCRQNGAGRHPGSRSEGENQANGGRAKGGRGTSASLAFQHQIGCACAAMPGMGTTNRCDACGKPFLAQPAGKVCPDCAPDGGVAVPPVLRVSVHQVCRCRAWVVALACDHKDDTQAPIAGVDHPSVEQLPGSLPPQAVEVDDHIGHDASRTDVTVPAGVQRFDACMGLPHSRQGQRHSGGTPGPDPGSIWREVWLLPGIRRRAGHRVGMWLGTRRLLGCGRSVPYGMQRRDGRGNKGPQCLLVRRKPAAHGAPGSARRRAAGFGSRTVACSGAASAPALRSASAPGPKKMSKRLAPLIAPPVSDAISRRA